ncbi:hypothetical protein [Bacillus mycoides]|uniref:hypothetical protein n=1 Tax=Bacillus mycoides TaxID=1405 RepID=UPI003D654620
MDEIKVVNEQAIVTNLENAKDASCEENNLREIIYELDEEIGEIGDKVSILEDVEILLGRLTNDMDRAVYKGEENVYFHEFHREIRVYWRLLKCTIGDLNEEYEKVDELKEELFDKVVKNVEKNQ